MKMWTVTVDSNVPITTNNIRRSDSPTPSDPSCRSKSRSFTPDKYLQAPTTCDQTDSNGVETLLSSSAPGRPRAGSFRDRPPSSAVRKVAAALRPRSRSGSRSHSPPNDAKYRLSSPDQHRGEHIEGWREEQWTFALENAVDDMEVNWDGFLSKEENERADRLNSSLDGVMSRQPLHSHYHTRTTSPTPSAPDIYSRGGSPRRQHKSGGSNSARLPVKALHDRPMSLLDSDSGVGSYNGRSGLSRSRSLSRLHTSALGSGGGDSGSSLTDSQHESSSPVMYMDRSWRELQNSLEDSESRRSVLMAKLKEAQTTLELQGDRLKKIESSARDNTLLVEDLKRKEKEYSTKISQLESAEKENQLLQVDNMRLREEMQERISSLDYQLKYLKSQHHNSESENNKRISLLDHTTMALSLLEEENSKLQQEKEKLHSEIALLRDAFCLTKTRFGALEEENKNIRNESLRVKEDNSALTKKVQEMAGQMIELRSLLQAVKDENERLSTTWKSSAEDKSRAARQVEGYQDTISDIKSRLAATSADRDRLFQEKLEMNGKLQQMVLDKEQLMKAKLNLEDQLTELQESKSRGASSRALEVRRDFDKRELNKELASVKKVSEELSAELSLLKNQYERSLEQVASLERSKAMLQSQADLGEQERRRMQLEIDRLNQALSDKAHEQNRATDYQDEQIHRLKSDLKEARYQNNEHENKIQELETRLAQANEGLREGTALQHSELDTWKSTCERLTSSVTRKESELQNLTDRCHEMEDTVLGLRQEIRALKDKNEMLSDRDDEAERLREEVRRLLQEKAENEQMIRLLETQKSVLTKSSEDNFGRLSELEHLSEQIDKLRIENEQLRKNKFDLEMMRDNLTQEKDEILANSEAMMKNSSLSELEGKIGELRDANRQLREMNETLTQKLDSMDEENSNLKQSFGNTTPKVEADKLREENTKLQAEYNDLKHEYGALDAKHQRFVINYGHDGDVAAREKQDMIKLRKERDAIQKQVTLLQGQLSLMEGSKRRSEEQLTKMTAELGEARAQLKQRDISTTGPSEGERTSKQETERLKRELEAARENIRVQEKMMKNLREESLEDVSSELQQMRGKLQELVGEIEQKDHTIETLELDLRRARGEAEVRSEEVTQMREAVGQMENENEALRQEVMQIRDTLASDLATEQKQNQGQQKRSSSAKSLQEELAEVVKAKQNGTYNKNRNQSDFLSKSLSSLNPRPASAPAEADAGGLDRPATEGSHRLQSLISKYRSHGDKEDQASSASSPTLGDGPRGIKPLPGFVSSKIVSPKGRFGGIGGGSLGGGPTKSPMRRSSSQEAGGGQETPISPLARQDGVVMGTASSTTTSTSVATSRPGRKLLPPPPPTSPKPILPALASLAASSGNQTALSTTTTSTIPPAPPMTSSTSPGSKSSFMRSVTTSEPNLSVSANKSSSKLGSPRRERDSSPLASLRATLPSSTGSKTLNSSSNTNSGSSSGLGQSLSASLDGPLSTIPDSGDHKEINALIQKSLSDRFDEMAAF